MKAFDKIIHVFDETFQENYYIFYGTAEKFFLDSVKINSDYDIPLVLGNGHFLCYQNEGMIKNYIWTKEKKPEILAHECIHAIVETMKTVDIPINNTNDEILTYQVEMLMRKTINNKK